MNQPNATQLTDEQIKRFQELYFEEFGIYISKGDAFLQGSALVRLTAIALRYTENDA